MALFRRGKDVGLCSVPGCNAKLKFISMGYGGGGYYRCDNGHTFDNEGNLVIKDKRVFRTYNSASRPEDISKPFLNERKFREYDPELRPKDIQPPFLNEPGERYCPYCYRKLEKDKLSKKYYCKTPNCITASLPLNSTLSAEDAINQVKAAQGAFGMWGRMEQDAEIEKLTATKPYFKSRTNLIKYTDENLLPVVKIVKDRLGAKDIKVAVNYVGVITPPSEYTYNLVESFNKRKEQFGPPVVEVRLTIPHHTDKEEDISVQDVVAFLAPLYDAGLDPIEQSRWVPIGDTGETFIDLIFFYVGRKIRKPLTISEIPTPSIPSNLWSNERVRRFEEIVKEEDKEKSFWRRIRKLIPKRDPYMQAFNMARKLFEQGKDRGTVYNVLLSKYRNKLSHDDIDRAFRMALSTPLPEFSPKTSVFLEDLKKIIILAFGFSLFYFEMSSFGSGQYAVAWLIPVGGIAIAAVALIADNYVSQQKDKEKGAFAAIKNAVGSGLVGAGGKKLGAIGESALKKFPSLGRWRAETKEQTAEEGKGNAEKESESSDEGTIDVPQELKEKYEKDNE